MALPLFLSFTRIRTIKKQIRDKEIARRPTHSMKDSELENWFLVKPGQQQWYFVIQHETWHCFFTIFLVLLLFIGWTKIHTFSCSLLTFSGKMLPRFSYEKKTILYRSENLFFHGVSNFLSVWGEQSSVHANSYHILDAKNTSSQTNSPTPPWFRHLLSYHLLPRYQNCHGRRHWCCVVPQMKLEMSSLESLFLTTFYPSLWAEKFAVVNVNVSRNRIRCELGRPFKDCFQSQNLCLILASSMCSSPQCSSMTTQTYFYGSQAEQEELQRPTKWKPFT